MPLANTLFGNISLEGMPLLALLVVCYLLGSIPTAVWMSKAFFKQDIRTLGSKNAGSTNMYRVFGFRAGFPVQLVDIAKGSLAAGLPLLPFVASRVGVHNPESTVVVQLLCGMAAVAGHIYTVLANFKGGKGVNTILGMMLVVAPFGSLVGILAFVFTLLASKMVSLGSMVAVCSFPVYLAVRYALYGSLNPREQILLAVALLLAALVLFTHRANIGRIVAGTESKAGFLTRKGRKVA